MMRLYLPTIANSCTRRELLRFGVPLWLAASAKGAPSKSSSTFGRAKSILIVCASGGQSQLETWDPKPDAPEEVRGAFASIPTKVPGVRLCEHLPQIARLADKFTIVRSMTHDDLDHGSALYLALTGQFHARKSSNPPPKPTDHPSWGSVLTRVRPAKHLPYTAVHLNAPVLVPEEPSPGQFGGFLGHRVEPIVIGDVTEGVELARILEPDRELPSVRLQARQSLLKSLDQSLRHADHDREALTKRAFELLASPHVRQSFDLSRENDRTRERYGRYRAGQACLLGRRLVEAGVPFVTVFFNHNIRGQDFHPDQTDEYGWDTHNDIFESMKTHLLPRFDQSFSALLQDLDERGLLDTTLVVCMGEFGRAPRVAREPSFKGNTPGRKHWAAAYSIVMAGAGVQRGAVHGATNRQAGYVVSDPVTPGDLTATIFHALGVDPSGHFEDGTGRPWPIASGQPIW